MNTNYDPEYQKAVIRCFRMPAVQTPVSRKSSITNAFVNAIIPVMSPTWQEIAEVLGILHLDPFDLRCAYCANRATEWDHLRPLVVDRRPTGFISEIANLVPSCNKCNQSKGNKDWRTWMLSSATWSPTGRGHTNVDERVHLLEVFASWRAPTRVIFEDIVGEAVWREYWASCERVIEQMAVCQQEANEIKKQAMAAVIKASLLETSAQTDG